MGQAEGGQGPRAPGLWSPRGAGSSFAWPESLLLRRENQGGLLGSNPQPCGGRPTQTSQSAEQSPEARGSTESEKIKNFETGKDDAGQKQQMGTKRTKLRHFNSLPHCQIFRCSRMFTEHLPHSRPSPGPHSAGSRSHLSLVIFLPEPLLLAVTCGSPHGASQSWVRPG